MNTTIFGKWNIEGITAAIEAGADVNQIDEDGYSFIHRLIMANVFNRNEILKLVIEKGADVNIQDKIQSRTPLRFASEIAGGRTALIPILLSHGADVNKADQFGRTPLHVAGNAEIVRLLLANGADIHAEDYQHATPLDYAIKLQPKRPDVILALLEGKPDIRHRNNSRISTYGRFKKAFPNDKKNAEVIRAMAKRADEMALEEVLDAKRGRLTWQQRLRGDPIPASMSNIVRESARNQGWWKSLKNRMRGKYQSAKEGEAMLGAPNNIKGVIASYLGGGSKRKTRRQRISKRRRTVRK